MDDLSGKSILLFCPKFFEYEMEIPKALEKLGADVIWYDDRPSNDFLSKVLIRLNKNFIKTKIKNYYSKILSDLKNRNVEPDYVFFINPEAISKEHLGEFRSTFPSAKFLLYMWDSFRNRRQNIELLPFFDAKFTFDSNDAKEYGLKLRALFYTDIYKSQPASDHNQYDILFIGTAHTDRYIFVKKIMKTMDEKKIKLYFYLSSKPLFYLKKLIDKDFKGVKYKDLSFHSLQHKDISKLMSLSKAVLDINHPKQIGLTMRTLETMGAGLKLITTNKDVLNYDFYNSNNILLIDRDHPFIDPLFLDSPMQELPNEILLKYSIEGWIKEIFNLS